jgi:hypothetical protein
MLIDADGRLSFRGEEVVERFGESLGGYCSLETHASVVEVETRPQLTSPLPWLRSATRARH